MKEHEIQTTIQVFDDVTKRAIKADFDGIELHGTHCFLLQNFFSPCLITALTDGEAALGIVCISHWPYCRKLKTPCTNMRQNRLSLATEFPLKNLQRVGLRVSISWLCVVEWMTRHSTGLSPLLTVSSTGRCNAIFNQGGRCHETKNAHLLHARTASDYLGQI